jgi:hypothetical protein
MKTPTSHGAPAAPRARVCLSWQRALHLYHLSTEIMEGLVQHTVNGILRVKGDEAKPPGTLCGLVIHHHNISDRAKGLKVLAELLICESGGQSTHEDLLRPSTTGVTATTTSSSTPSVPSGARVHRLGSLLLLTGERTLDIDLKQQNHNAHDA